MATWKKIIVSGSQAQLAGVTGSFTGSFIGDGSQLTGVSAAGTLSSSAQIASDISGSFSATHLNTKVPGVISGSAQLPSGIISGAAQLPSGTVSGSAQTIANLPAGTVSGSAQVNADTITNFDTNVDSRLDAKGVISSSAQVDGDFLNTTGDGALSSSAQIATEISGALSVTALNSVSPGIISGAAQLPSGTVSGSAQTIAHLPSGTISGSAQLPSGIISGAAQLPSGTISGSTQVVAALPAGTVSGSSQVDADSITNFDNNVDTRINAKGVVSGSAQVTLQDADKTGFTGANSITTLGTVVAGDVSAILPSGTVSSSAQITAGSGQLSSSAQIADDISGSFSAAHLNTKVAGVISASAESDAQGQIKLNGVNVDANALGTGDSPQFTNLTLSGNLTVNGTTTTVNSTTIEMDDNILALNGTAASKGGIAVNDATAPTTNSGSLLWDGANDYWVAGPTGSETKIFVAGATGDGLVSASGQIPALLPSGVVSGSAQTVANLPSGTVSGSAQTIANLSTTGIISGAAQINATALNLNANGNQFSGSFEGDGSGLTGVTAAGTLSSSAQIASDISGALSVTALNSVSPGIVSGAAQLPSGIISGAAQLPSGTVSGSAQTVANLNNQDVDLGTGDITGVSASFGFIGTAASIHTGSFSGDGSNLSNITVDQNATVTASFSNASTASVTHNFDSDNIIVVAYDGDDEQFIPSTIKAVNSNTVELHFSVNSTGRAIVARGGHIVSGSIPFSNIISLPTLVSSSAQIASDISGSLSNTAIAALGSGIISSSTQIDTDLFDIDGLVSGAAQVTSLLPTGTVSGSAQVNADTITNFDTNVKAKMNADGVISGSSQLDNTRLNLTDATGSFTGSFTGDGSGLTGVVASGTISSSAQIADDISGSLSATAVAALGAGIVSGSSAASSAQGQFALTTNGVAASAVDLGLQTTDSPTFAGLTVAGDLTVTGNTIEAQVTNLNVEDKYILLNSGSTSGDSGIVFGGADGVANQGVGLFWDNGYNSNDGRLAIVNSIAAGATGDQTPAYHIVGAIEGNAAAAETAQADHVGNIRVESEEIYIYV